MRCTRWAIVFLAILGTVFLSGCPSPNPDTYSLTMNTEGQGAVNVNPPGGAYTSGTAVTVTATASGGWHFDHWEGGLTGSVNPATITIDANTSVMAVFAINSYTLTYTAGTNGTLSGSTAQTVNYGADGTAVTAVPNTGYRFVKWSDNSTQNPRTDTSVTANLSVTAIFDINQYTLMYMLGVGGSLRGITPQTVNPGASGTAITAVPDTGYHFVQWSDNSTQNPRTDTNVTGDISVTATFAINTYTLAYMAGANGSITGTTPQTVNHGASGTEVTAQANASYHFVKWSDNSTQNPRTDTNVTGDMSVTATFANTYTLTYTAGADGSITGTTPQTVNPGASGTAVTAVPNTGHHFVQWSDPSTQNPRIDTNVTTDINVTATFAINTYTLTYTAGAGGTITGVSPQTVNYGASGTPVTAVPNTGYHFVQWSDGVLTATRTDTNVTANIGVTAIFAINIYTLTYTAGANGSITGATPQTVNHGASGTAVTAVPNTGYHFVKWSDNSTQNPRTDTNVTASMSVTASFAINQYILTYTAGANGSITGTSPQTVNHGASGTAVTAVPNTGYHFVQWSDNSTQNPRTDTNVMANISVTAVFAGNIRYVKLGGTGDGTSWSTAFGSIQPAVEAIQLDEGEVWVAGGTYTGTASTPVLVMRHNVHIYGGFRGDETTRDERNFTNTVIDGNGERCCVNGINNATLDGFVIKNGNDPSGGGMNNTSASPTVDNCTFESNSDSGMYNDSSSSPTVTNCTFESNYFGMYNSSSSPTVTNCTFESNSGSGMYNDSSSSPTVTNCTFESNSGGGMCNSSSSPTVTNCTFTSNTTFGGGGMYNSSSSPTVTNCTFTSNTASEGHGGGMCNTSSSPTVTNCTFTSNTASRDGGGMYNASSSSQTVTNCTFTSNTASNGSGGGMDNWSYSSPTVTNCTFTLNTGYNCGGMAYDNCPNMKIANCIFWNDNAPEIVESSAVTVTYSCIQNGYTGTGNIDTNPLFVDAAGNVRLQATSPCIDTGTRAGAPETDIEGTTRPQGAGVDMGAYER